MTTPYQHNYGCGVEIETKYGHRTISHGGGINGFNTMLSYSPDDRLLVVVLSNINGQAPDDIASKLEAVARGQAVILPSERKSIALAPTVLARYTGTYKLLPELSLTIAQEGDQLTVQEPGGEKTPLLAESETKFFSKDPDAQIDFTRDARGTVTGLVLHQGGRDLPGSRELR
jgi:hypothetical protein